MKLYHGSLERVEFPQIMEREIYRPLDFGTGFYTTTNIDQAKKWVENRLRHFRKTGSGFVSVYELDEDKIRTLKVKHFDGVSVEWLRFIAENRMHYNIEHEFDVVVGPVANDRVYTVLTLYEGGYYEEEEAMRKMKGYRLANQYLFHTKKALECLHYVACEEVLGNG